MVEIIFSGKHKDGSFEFYRQTLTGKQQKIMPMPWQGASSLSWGKDSGENGLNVAARTLLTETYDSNGPIFLNTHMYHIDELLEPLVYDFADNFLRNASDNFSITSDEITQWGSPKLEKIKAQKIAESSNIKTNFDKETFAKDQAARYRAYEKRRNSHEVASLQFA